MPSRPKKITSKSAKKKLKNIHHSKPTLQLQVQELGGCETASVTCQSHSGDQYSLVEEEERRKVSADLNEMEDSSNGKLEGTEKIHQEDVVKDVVDEDVGDSKPVVESVRDIAIDDYTEPAKKTHDGGDDSSSSSSSSSSADEEAEEPAEKSAQVVDSGEVEETEEVSVKVVETVESLSNHLDEDVVDLETKEVEEEKILPPVEETYESSPAITDVVEKQIEEKTLSYSGESNGVSPVETTLPNDESAPVITDAVSIEETEVIYSEENTEVASAVTDVVSKGIEETKLPVSEETIGESSSKPLPEVPPVESAGAGEEYGRPEIPESTGNPSIVSVTGRPLQPTSWKSCCGLFEVLHRSDR